ncbi:hypothetical protein HYE67_010730 [Fusarium culmorum]|uniref:Uncharacterized protein n=1 Tax=Fusarium culmorum TaxID=5516 RepID=A0A2T4GGU7_FUSCU|nr:hypothetical protein FCULG_00009771 [Fusarium culmorum]QPC68499.1 hypothetical protein HYE67_010730 [Fusarium culmorum]
MGPGTISGPIREWKFCDAEDRAIPGTLIRELVARVKTLWYLVSVPQLVIVRREEARKVFPQTIVMSQSAAQYVMWGRSCPNTARQAPLSYASSPPENVTGLLCSKVLVGPLVPSIQAHQERDPLSAEPSGADRHSGSSMSG